MDRYVEDPRGVVPRSTYRPIQYSDSALRASIVSTSPSLLLLLLATLSSGPRSGVDALSDFSAAVARTASAELGVLIGRSGRQHPGVLGPAALRRVDDQTALRNPPLWSVHRQNEDAVPVVDRERPQVHMPRLQPFTDLRGHSGQLLRRAARSSPVDWP